jgi:hypothetical protein
MLLGLFSWATAVVLYGLLVPSALQAQYPRARRGQFEVQGFDFRRDGGWRRRVALVRSARHRWLREGAVGALNLASPTAPRYFIAVNQVAARSTYVARDPGQYSMALAP